MKELFFDISNTRVGMVRSIERLAEWIGEKGMVTLDEVDEEDFDAANKLSEMHPKR